MDLSKKKQEQTAGDNSTQTQIENQNNVNVSVNNYYGVPSTDLVSIAASIFDQMATHAMKEYTGEAIKTATDRIKSFGYELFPRFNKVNGAMEMFKDPKFQFWLRDAQITAAKTARTEDFSILAELLSCHFLKGDDKKIDAGIHQAINIVDEIDSDALCALTVAYAFQYYYPVTDTISDGLKALDELFEELIYMSLPNGVKWLDHMDLLGALRLSALNKSKSKGYLCSRFNVCTGLRQGSEELDRAYTILDENDYPRSYLIKNECVDGYLILKGALTDDVDNYINDDNVKNQILGLYLKDKNILNSAKERFIELWDSYSNLKVARNWWDQIPNWFRITYMGRVLAQTNAKRIDPDLPDLI